MGLTPEIFAEVMQAKAQEALGKTGAVQRVYDKYGITTVEVGLKSTEGRPWYVWVIIIVAILVVLWLVFK